MVTLSTATASPAHANSTPGMNKSMTTPLSEELREKIASELYARFWARNGVSAPPLWADQAEAICNMWRSIASDALLILSLLPVGWVGESGSSCVAEPGTVFPDAHDLLAWPLTEREAGNDLCDRLDAATDRLREAEARNAKLVEAGRAALVFYDRADFPHMPGEVKVLDDLSAALALTTPEGK